MCDREQKNGVGVNLKVNELVRETGEFINAGSMMVRRKGLWRRANRGNAGVEFGNKPCREALTDASVPSAGVAGFLNGSRVKFNCRHRCRP